VLGVDTSWHFFARGRHLRLLLLLGLGPGLLAGCVPVHRYGTARTLPEGKVSVVAALDLVQGYEPQLEEEFAATFPVGAPRVGVHVGVAERTEIGLEMGASYATLDVKRQLVRSRAGKYRFSVTWRVP